MSPSAKRHTRRFHFWAALIIAIPVVIVIVSGLLLQVKKQFEWVQPPTARGQAAEPTIAFTQILSIAQRIDKLSVSNWQDIQKLDVRPSKGVIKILAVNNWEAQIDADSGKLLHIAYRRSDTIEAIHDGSFFHDSAKLWIFLPVAIALLLIWLSGIFLLGWTLRNKFKRRHRHT
ncbi:PepSY domain-containing protein [Flocculibacter collagenilyticus]|uniref:PepSY domain-containing protein n=1 Tax=Flocculibacter collagenilyticus TaxID=2744479 RepID=UPI0018F3AFCD|nr:PepSY domain-containing protein [Flocculibacter collagenilyticus]